MSKIIPNGVWPTMITPYTKYGEIDFDAVEELVEWYISKGVSGIFAICQSSEMFFLTEEEKLRLVEFILKVNKGRVCVVASGTTHSDLCDQIAYAKKIIDAGVDGVVFLRNCIKGDFKEAIGKITDAISEKVALGFYECPYPNKVCLSEDEFKFIISTERFAFLKDTVCDLKTIATRAEIAKGSSLKLYNANEATLYESLKLGYSG